MTALSHGIKNCNAQRSHLKMGSQLPDVHQRRVLRDHSACRLVVDLTCVYEVLKAAEGLNIIFGESNNHLDCIGHSILGEVVTVVRGLRAKDILLNAKGNLIWANEEDDEDWVRVAGHVRGRTQRRLRYALP